MQIQNKTTNKQVDSIATLIPDEINKLSNFYIDDGQGKSIFIPFYLIGTENKTYEFIVNQQIKSERTNLKVGNTENKFHVTVNELNTITINKISFKTKNIKSYDKIYLTIKHGNTTVLRTDSKSISKKMEWNIEQTKIITHNNDILTITVFGTDKYGLSTEIYSKQLKSKTFAKEKNIKLKGNKNIKKLMIF